MADTTSRIHRPEQYIASLFQFSNNFLFLCCLSFSHFFYSGDFWEKEIVELIDEMVNFFFSTCRCLRRGRQTLFSICDLLALRKGVVILQRVLGWEDVQHTCQATPTLLAKFLVCQIQIEQNCFVIQNGQQITQRNPRHNISRVQPKLSVGIIEKCVTRAV